MLDGYTLRTQSYNLCLSTYETMVPTIKRTYHLAVCTCIDSILCSYYGMRMQKYALEFTSSSPLFVYSTLRVQRYLKLDRVVLFTRGNLASECDITFELYK